MKFVVFLALVGTAGAMSFCEPCKAVVGFIEQEITRDEPAEQKVLDEACNAVTHDSHGILTRLCEAAVNEGLKLVVHFIDTKQPPATVCHEAHLCSSLEVAQVVDENEANVSPDDIIKEFCSIDALAIKELSSGQLVALCKQFHIDNYIPHACEEIAQYKPIVVKVLQEAQDLLCHGQGQVFAAANACQIVTEVVNLVEEVDKLSFIPPQVAAALKKALPYLQQLKAAVCHSSVSHMSVMEQTLAGQNQICSALDEADNLGPFVCDLIHKIQPTVDCSVVDSKLKEAITVLKQLLHCPSSLRNALAGISKAQICQILADLKTALPEVSALCKQYLGNEQVCGEIAQAVSQIEPVIKVVEQFLGCSE